MLMTLTALLLAGCGGSEPVGRGSGGGAKGGATPTAPASAPAPTAVLPCYGASTPSEGMPTVILRNTSGPKEAVVPVGMIVEIRLSGKNKWDHSSSMPSGALTSAGAQGALEHGDCVWDFRVAQSGKIVVTFIGGALCRPNEACPQYALLATFTINE
jgi:hypothetical protein